MIDSFEKENICLNFCCATEKRHVCIPMIIGGTVGVVVQIIVDETTNKENLRNRIKELKKFLRETAPVVEAKRLLSKLKESTLRDPLTGLVILQFNPPLN